jgi:hypothetical protein
MSQTSAIILSFDKKAAPEFERIFEAEVLPLWRQFKSAGKITAASLTPIEGGNQLQGAMRKYILHVEVPSMAEHVEFDSNALFNKFLSRAQAMQPVEPLVMFGDTLFQV